MTFGVENIEGSTSMSTMMSDNARATPDPCPGYSGATGFPWGQEAQERFLRGRRTSLESGKVYGSHAPRGSPAPEGTPTTPSWGGPSGPPAAVPADDLALETGAPRGRRANQQKFDPLQVPSAH